MPDDDWPRCPQCEKPRTTQCPICYSNGTNFTVVDPEYLGVPVDENLPERKTCDCDSTGCVDPAEGSCVEDASPFYEGVHGPSGSLRMLMCSTCDEPFEPSYPIRCEWCGQQFADGYEVVEPPPPEKIGGRILFVMLCLALLTMLIVGYMHSLFG